MTLNDKPTCPYCGRWLFIQVAREPPNYPEFRCLGCNKTWECGPTGGQYAGAAFNRCKHGRLVSSETSCNVCSAKTK